ncbi:MAG: hypothetical protein AAF320_00795 [Myxococcota bacterium]
MLPARYIKALLFYTTLGLTLNHMAFAKEDADASIQNKTEQEIDLGQAQRRTPSGYYLDPGSLFFWHGYINGVYANLDNDFGKSPLTQGQILVNGSNRFSGANTGGFQHDAALFVGSEMFQGFQGVLEIHFVRSALDPVLTEAKIMWHVINKKEWPTHLAIGVGRQWWPFGVHNRQWFSSLNPFNVISPVATHVLPPHHNEIGAWLEGYSQAGKVALNYVVSVGNGPLSFGMMDNVRINVFGHSKKPAVTGRFGIKPGLPWLEIGASGAWGGMRDGSVRGADENPEQAQTDPRFYAADFWAAGADLQIDTEVGFRLVSDFAWSQEMLRGDSPRSSLDRFGFHADAYYGLPIPQYPKWLWSIGPKVLYSEAWIDQLQGGREHGRHIGFGANYYPIEQVALKVEYVFVKGGNGAGYDKDNIFDVGLVLSW